MSKQSYITVTDQFCGAGGSSQGAVNAGAELRLALNHWRLAIETHNTNFPDADHDCTDMSAVDPRRYASTDILITSPECTNHSLAKGRKRTQQSQMSLWKDGLPDPSEERSRATMWDVPRFAEFHNYRMIIVENVVDARHWKLWEAWLHAMTLLGYDHEIVYANSMFHWPTPQSRDRMYVVFWKHGLPRPNLDYRPRCYCTRCERDVEGVQSWKNPQRRWGRYGARNQYVYCCPNCAQEAHPYYYPAATAIDWSLPGERIGDKKRPLKERTLQRIQYGLDKFGKHPLTVQLDHTHSDTPRAWPVNRAMPTQTTRQVLALMMPFLIQYYTRYYGAAVSGIDAALPGVNTEPRHALIQPPFLIKYYAPKDMRYHNLNLLDEPTDTITAIDHHGMVIQPPMITSVNYFDEIVRGVDEPLPTQTTAQKAGLTIPPAFIAELRNTGTAREVDDPLSTVTAGGNHHGLVLPMPFLSSYYGNDQASAIADPVPTIPTLDHHALVVPEVAVEDCFFRMLQPHEIGRAMAFPDDYVVLGNSREKVKQYGNAVTPPVMAWIMQQVMEALR